MTNTKTGALSIEHVLLFARRRAPIVLVAAVLVGGAALVFSLTQEKKYTASAALVFNNNQTGQQVAGLQALGNNAQQATQDTNVQLVSLGDMAAVTARAIGGGWTEDDVRASLTVRGVGATNVVEVSATTTSPLLAARIANTYSQQFVAEQDNGDKAYYRSALAVVQRQLGRMTPAQRADTAGLALQSRAQSLAVLAELRSGTVRVAERASAPDSPSSPKTVRNTMLGGILGLALGLALAALVERFDRRVKSAEELSEVYDLPLVGTIPHASVLERSGERDDRATVPPAVAESFHLVRAQLQYFNVDRQLRTWLVTSAAAGEGKSTVAQFLAESNAAIGLRVLLVEADLRRPSLAARTEASPRRGLADLLTGSANAESVIQHVRLSPGFQAADASRGIDVVVAGEILPPNPAELLRSEAMGGFVGEAARDYDLVVIDTPPLTVVADAFPLLSLVDGVVVVGRVGRTDRDTSTRLRDAMAGIKAPVVGVVANDVGTATTSYYGAYHSYGVDGAVPSTTADVA